MLTFLDSHSFHKTVQSVRGAAARQPRQGRRIVLPALSATCPTTSEDEESLCAAAGRRAEGEPGAKR